MRVGGIFIGLSAQWDTRIPALAFGARDARRLHAAFADANEAVGAPGSLLRLLVNDAATVNQVRSGLDQAVIAANESGCDVFILHFSGHGSPDGRVVLYDTERHAIPSTAIPIAELSATLAKLKGSHVLIVLDCCFSGTVIGWPGSDNAVAFAQLMQELSGDVRAVVWAAGASERAFEAPELSHGYLSFGLLAVLESARAQGRTSLAITEWLQGALDRAQELLSRDGYPQTPGGHLRTSAGARIPVPPLGRSQEAFSEFVGMPSVTPDLASLGVYGFKAPEIEALTRKLGIGAQLNTLQREAIAPAGLLAGSSVLVRAPTSAGKTLIAELAILRHWREGRRAVILSPTRALVREQTEMFRAAYGALGLGVVHSTGEVTDDDDLLLSNNYDVAFLTYEKFAAMLGLRPSLLTGVGVVVTDELQLVEDESRGRLLELLLVRLHRAQRGGIPQMIALCGEVGNLAGLDACLELTPVGPGVRPIPLTESVIGPDGVLKSLQPSRGTASEQLLSRETIRGLVRGKWPSDVREAVIVALVTSLLAAGKQVLVFRTSKRGVLSLAKRLSRELALGPVASLRDSLESIPSSDRHRAAAALFEAAKTGIGIHIADLDASERRLVEDAFRSGEMRLLVATTTLAMGINTPADAAVIGDSAFYRGGATPELPLRLTEYRNMAGRAGRLLVAGPTAGDSYLVAHSEPETERLWRTYLDPPAVGLQSTLSSLSPDDLLVAMLGIVGEGGVQDAVDVLVHTFMGHQNAGISGWVRHQRRLFDETLPGLISDSLVEEAEPPTVRLTATGKVAASLVLRVESIRRLRRALRAITSANEPIDDVALLVLTELTVELETVYGPSGASELPSGSRGPLNARPATYAALTDRTGLPPAAADSLVSGRIRRLIGSLDWIAGRSLEEVERRYAGDVREPVLGQLRAAATRSADVLVGVTAVIRATVPGSGPDLLTRVANLRARLEVGGNVAASRLHRLRLGLSRRQCLDLVASGVNDEQELRLAIQERSNELEAALSTPVIQLISAQLLDLTSRRRFRSTDADQLMLDFQTLGAEV